MTTSSSQAALLPIRSYHDYAYVVPTPGAEQEPTALCVNADVDPAVLLSAAHGRVERVRDLLKPFNGHASNLAEELPSDVISDFLYAVAGIADEAEQLLHHAVTMALRGGK